MSLSNIFYKTTSFSLAIPTLPQFREPHQENHFDWQNFVIRASLESLVRASTFITYLERNLNVPKGSKSSLQALLELSLHLPATEENKLLLSEITEAFFKQKGYFSRFFSNESWDEWFENRTALGKVVFQFKNCIESRAKVCSFTKEMNPQLIQKANEESSVLLKALGSREVTRTSKDSCLYGLTSGIAASFLLENPLPVLMGLSACFPRAHAQQKVGNEFQVNTYTPSYQMKPSVASFSNGNFVVTWESFSGSPSSGVVYGQLFNGNGTKIGSEFQANSYTDNYQGSPSAVSLSNGNFVVTWQSQGQDGDGWGVYGQLFNGNGTKIGSEFRANTNITFDQQEPSVASFSNDNFVVTWNGRYDVYGQLFDGNGSKIGSDFRANSYTMSWQSQPSVASFSNDGNFVVTWFSYVQDGNSSGIYGQLFNGNGSNIGNEFRASTYTIHNHQFPAVTSLADGNFVVTWQSTDQDGSGEGVYGQLFNGNGTKIGSEFRANSYTTSLPAIFTTRSIIRH